MTSRTTTRSRIPETDLYRMETRLGAALHGVAPRPDFVTGLRSRLATQSPEAHTSGETQTLLFLSVVGVLAGMVLIVAGAKAFAALLGLLGLIHPQASSDADPARL